MNLSWTGVLTDVEINLARYLLYLLDHNIVPLDINLVSFHIE